MAYYYRGILYWFDGELDNARACFRSAQIMDGDAENKSYASDYVLLDYLDGLATARLGGDGSDALKRAEAEARMTKPPEYDLKANVLFFVEFGNGPLKYATGQYGEERMQGRAYALGELVQALLEKHGSRFRVAAVVADMFNGRWIVRIESSRGNLSLTIPRDLVDDVLDSGQASEVAKMKVIIRAGVSKAGEPSR